MSNSKGSVNRLCEQCGGPFKTKPSLIKKGAGKYCCKQCKDESLRVPPEIRFWASVDRSGGDSACWLWTGGRARGGYGRLWVNGKTTVAHRFSYELHNGPVTDGLVVMHRCDNPPCCNPAHLTVGTNADNTADMVAKGRAPKGNPDALEIARPLGEKHHNAKLTMQSAQEIVRLYQQGGSSMRSLADRYGVQAMSVCKVIHGKTWSAATAQSRAE
jgi:hypothetical protein